MRDRLIFPMVVALTALASLASAQVDTAWVRRYMRPGSQYSETRGMAVDATGNVYVTGSSYDADFVGDYCTIKYNSAGVQQWVKCYNGPGNSDDQAWAIAADAAGNVYVTGLSTGSGTGEDCCTIKYNSAGVEQWVQRYNGPGNAHDAALAIALDAVGGVYVTGSRTDSDNELDYCTIKYNSAGAQQWIQFYNGPANGFDDAHAIAVDASGGVYVTGTSEGLIAVTDFCTVKYNSAGVEQWVQRYNGPGNEVDDARAIAVDASGSVYVTGFSLGSGTSYDFCTIKYNSAGVELWVQRYNGPENMEDYGWAVAVDASGNVFVTGQNFNSGSNADYCTIKYNSAGVEQWVQRYNGPGNAEDYSVAMAMDAAGGVYVAGFSIGSGTDADYYTIKYNSVGVEQWGRRYNGTGNSTDWSRAIALDASGNVFVAGVSVGPGSTYDFCTIKYVQQASAAGWYARKPMPDLPSGKQIRDGAWLVEVGGLIYAVKGGKQADFYSYDPLTDVWTQLAPWQLGTEGKMPSKGSAGCADGNGVIYATKGNNKAGFWKYTAATNAWAQLADVPLGVSNKKVKGGTSIVWAYNAGIGSPYLLKGYKNEFYQYDVVANTWRTLTPAPVGANQKWDKGSWIVSDGAHTLYAHKAKYNEFYSYNIETGVWSGPLVGMSTASGKKAKDGSCAAFTPAGTIFAFKGGNTQEFQQCTFTTDGNSWAQKETVPRGVFKKKVKAGAGMVAIGGLVFATKGNKDNSLWMYVPSSFAPEPETPQHDGVLAGKTVTAQGMSLSPNPLASGFAVLRYGLPKAGAARLSVYNMAGQTVMAQTLVAGRSGNVNLDLRHLSNGVYLVKLSSDGFENSQKLVVQR